MRLRWKRRAAAQKSNEEEQEKRLNRIAYEVYQNRRSRGKSGDAQSDWQTAEKIAGTRIRIMLFLGNCLLIRLDKRADQTFKVIAWDTPRWFLFSLPKLEWVKLLAVPLALGAAGSIITAQIQREANQNSVLKAYFDQLEELTFNQDLLAEEPQTGAIVLARGRTMAVLRELDLQRKTQLLAFLQASGLSRFDGQSEVIEEPVISFKNQDFSDLDLRGVNLGRTDFSQANLRNTNLERAFLGDANLEWANLADANLTGAFLVDANLTEAYLGDADLEGANLADANLEGANLVDANLTEAFLTDANLTEAFLRAANLEGAFLGEANLEGAILGEANLTGANLGAANLEGAFLRAANLEGASLGEANLTGANLGAANLEGASLRDANLTGANLGVANLEWADLRAVNLEGAFLEDANLEGAVLLRTRLSNAEGLTAEQLSKAQLCETELPDYIDFDPNYRCEALKEQFPELF